MSIRDVARYILENTGEITAMKLQKLCYYAQAWSLVWDERPLFPERIEAWANGPVCPSLYAIHRGSFSVHAAMVGGNVGNLDQTARETIDAVLATYGNKASHWLSDLTHSEAPWIEARVGLADGERGSREITIGALADYYGNL